MAAKKKAKIAGGKSNRGLYTVLGVLGVVAVAALGYSLLRAGSGGAATQPVDIGNVTEPARLFEMAAGIPLGNENAPVRVITFIDFQCPGCAAFARSIEPLLRQQYVDTGLVQLVYYDYPIPSIHPQAFVAARAARCANEQNRFWDFHDVLLARQMAWSGSGTAINMFGDYAAELGLDRAAFDACLRSDRFAQTVSASMELGRQLNVQGTPTVFVNNRVANVGTWDDLRALIDAEIGA